MTDRRDEWVDERARFLEAASVVFDACVDAMPTPGKRRVPALEAIFYLNDALKCVLRGDPPSEERRCLMMAIRRAREVE